MCADGCGCINCSPESHLSKEELNEMGVSRMIYYVEMEDVENEDGMSNKVDIYGYRDQVKFLAFGAPGHYYDVNNEEEAKNLIEEKVKKLEDHKFKIIATKGLEIGGEDVFRHESL